MVAVGSQPRRIFGERDDDGLHIRLDPFGRDPFGWAPGEVIAHGDHVFLARQSSEVSMEDE